MSAAVGTWEHSGCEVKHATLSERDACLRPEARRIASALERIAHRFERVKLEPHQPSWMDLLIAREDRAPPRGYSIDPPLGNIFGLCYHGRAAEMCTLCASQRRQRM